MSRAANARKPSAAQLQQEVDRLRAEIVQLRGRTEQPRHARAPRFRNTLSVLCIILSDLALIPAIVLVWLNHNLLDQTGYIKTVGPIIQQPAVQAAITKQASTRLFSAAHVERAVAAALPPRAEFLASPVAAQVQQQTTDAIGRIVASQKFYDIWIATNKAAHATFVRLAASGQADPTINLNDVYQFISKQLQDTKLAPLLNKQLPPNIGSIHVATIPALAKIPEAVAKLNRWRLWLVALVVILSIAAILLAIVRTKAVMGIGIAWIAAALVTLVGIRLVRGFWLEPIVNPQNRDAAIAIWQTLLQYLYVELAVVGLLGLVVSITGWTLGASHRAVLVRATAQSSLAGLRGRIIRGPAQQHAVIRFFQTKRRWLEWGTLLGVILLLIAFAPLSVKTLLVIVATGLLLLCVVEMLGAPDS